MQRSEAVAQDQLSLDRRRLAAYERVLDTATDQSSRQAAREEISYLQTQIRRQERMIHRERAHNA